MCNWLKYISKELPTILNNSKKLSLKEFRTLLDLNTCVMLRRWTIEKTINWLAFYDSRLERLAEKKPVWSPFEFQSKMNFGPPVGQLIKLIKKKEKNGEFIVADIGCGTGLHAIEMAKQFKKATIYAFEPSLDMFNHLCLNVQHSGLENIMIGMSRLSDLTRKFFNKFDIIFSFRMAHFANSSSIEKVYSDLSKLLRKNGILILQEYIIPEELDFNQKEAFCESITRAVWLKHAPISERELYLILKKLKFEKIDMVSFDFNSEIGEYKMTKEEEELGKNQLKIINGVCRNLKVDSNMILNSLRNLKAYLFIKK